MVFCMISFVNDHINQTYTHTIRRFIYIYKRKVVLFSYRKYDDLRCPYRNRRTCFWRWKEICYFLIYCQPVQRKAFCILTLHLLFYSFDTKVHSCGNKFIVHLKKFNIFYYLSDIHFRLFSELFRFV